MRMSSASLTWVAAAVVWMSVAAACGSGGDHTASSRLTGHWSGPISDNGGGDGFMDVDFTQNGSTIGGTWQMTYDSPPNGDPTFDTSGTLAGSVFGNSVEATFTPSDPGRCEFAVDGTREGEDDIIGNYDTQPVEPSCTRFQGNFAIAR
jgi:hypothetical protein